MHDHLAPTCPPCPPCAQANHQRQSGGAPPFFYYAVGTSAIVALIVHINTLHSLLASRRRRH